MVQEIRPVCESACVDCTLRHLLVSFQQACIDKEINNYQGESRLRAPMASSVDNLSALMKSGRARGPGRFRARERI